MKTLFLLLLLIGQNAFAAFTEFYAQTTASNLNAGSDANDAAELTSANGNWDSTTGIFVCNGATDLSGVAVGEWASVYTDGASVGVFVGRITAVVDATDTITVSLTAKSGTAPSTSATARTIKVGGAWKGPNAAENFPYNFVQNTMTDASGNTYRVNLKGTNTVTAAVTHTLAGPGRFQGYTNTVGDFGKAGLANVTTTASYAFLSVSGANLDVLDIDFDGSVFTTGTQIGVTVTGVECSLSRCSFHGFRGAGLSISGASAFCTVIECEAYDCNKNNSSASGGIIATTDSCLLIRSVSHDNVGSNNNGFVLQRAIAVACIADTNGKDGFSVSAVNSTFLINCDSYNNGGAGCDLSGVSAAHFTIQNSNFIKNGTYGINSSGSLVLRNGSIINCGFGSGTQTNASGSIISGLTGISVIGTVTYAADVTPWVAPTTGDFRINLATAKGAGRGAFTETQASYTGTVGYPDIGAAQHSESAGSTGGGSYTFAQ